MKKTVRKIMSVIMSIAVAITMIGTVPWVSEVKVSAITSADLNLSDNGVAFICAREGFHSKCYSDYAQSSIGYGTKCTASSVQPHASGSHSITKEAAMAALKTQTNNVYAPRVRAQTVGIEMNQNQFDALVSLCYNCGGGSTLIANSPLVKYLKGQLTEAQARSQYSNYIVTASGNVLQGLINRRNSEAELFFTGVTSTPTANNPEGHVDSIAAGAGTISLSGWAFDRDAINSALEIHVYVSGNGYNAGVANVSRPDVNNAYGISGNHGFATTINVNQVGTNKVTVYAINKGGGNNVVIWEGNLNIQQAQVNNPDGKMDKISGGNGNIYLEGWAVDGDDLNSQLEIYMYVGNARYSVGRTDIYKPLGLASGVHGFAKTINVNQFGNQAVKVYAKNVGGGSDFLLWSGTLNIKQPAYDLNVISDGKTIFTTTGNNTKLLYLGGNYVDMSWLIPKKAGYTFTGYYTAKSGGTKLFDASGKCCNDGTYFKNNLYQKKANLTMYAQWSRNNYTLYLNPNGGKFSDGSTSNKSFNGLYKDSTNWYLVQTYCPSKSGYVFNGYWTATSGGVRVYNEKGIATNEGAYFKNNVYQKASNLTVYAQWKKPTCTIKFDAMGGSASKTSVNITQGQKIGTLPTATRTGYTFNGWFTAKTGGTKITANTVYNANSTVYAQWKANTYKRILNTNGGTCDVEYISLTLEQPIPSLPVPTKAGYTFGGWYWDINLKEGTAIKVGAPITYPSDSDWFAKWIPNTYKLTFNPNGGVCDTESITVDYEQAIGELPTPNRIGYNFIGWFNAEVDGEKITAETKPLHVGDMEYFAHWAKDYSFGDVNNDEKISVSDYVAVKKCLVYKDTSDVELDAIDFNKDGKVNVFDLMILKRTLFSVFN